MRADYTKNLRILHIIDSGGMYGAERVLLGLAQQCASWGDEVIVGTMVSLNDAGDPLGEAVKACGLQHERFLMRDGFNVHGLNQILQFARERQVDVIHSHGYRANIMLGVVPRRYRTCAMICTLHGWTAKGRLGRLAAYEWLDRFVVHRFDRVVAVSEPIRKMLARTVPAARLARVSNGIAVDVAMKAPASKLGPRHDTAYRPLLLAAGRLSYEKGFDLLVNAIALLRQEGTELRAVIAGDGPMRESMRHLVAKHGLADRVELLGFRDNLGPLFLEADLFVLPSRSEGLPLVLLEAMAHRLPVVATPVGEVPTVLEGGRLGTLARAADANALAEALRRGLAWRSDSDVITQQAREQVVIAYSLESMAAGYRAEYLRALSAAPNSLRQASRP